MAKKLTVTQKRWLVSAHILFSVIWLGTSLCLLVLDVAAVGTNDPRMLHAIFLLAEVLDKALIWGSSIAALATGVLLSVLTHWGLIRFYWIIVKELLSIFSFLFGYLGLHTWLTNLDKITAIQSTGATYTINLQLHLIGGALQLIALATMVIISVFKPWGQRRQAKKPAVALHKRAS